jgi:hypothetical protein
LGVVDPNEALFQTLWSFGGAVNEVLKEIWNLPFEDLGKLGAGHDIVGRIKVFVLAASIG